MLEMRTKQAALSEPRSVVQWIEKNFTCENESGVWFPKDRSRELLYSDGDQFENRLLEIMVQATDRAVGSLELERSIIDFPSRYHLSSRRANLLRPIQHLLGGRVLEVGAGCGALSRFLGELGAEVWALEGSARRARICAARCRDLSSVRVFRSNVEEFDPPVRFDAITLVGVLEYSRLFLSGEDKVGRMLEVCGRLLNEEGVLIIAIENQLGMKYFAGAPEDHLGRPFCGINDCYNNEGPVTYGRVELEKLIQRSGFRACEFLYPFPDYKFPRVVLHASACRFPDINIASLIRTCTAEDQGIPYDRIFAEEMAWPVAARNELVGSLANSFLVVASRKEDGAPRVSPERVAYIYSESRRRCYAKQTVLVADSGRVHVRRSRLYPEAVPADDSYRNQIDDKLLLKGNLWIDRLFPVVNRIGWTHEEIAAWARPWVEYLQREAVGHDSGQAMLPPHFVDCTPYNSLEQPDGELCAIDSEWVAREPVALKFVVFRGLFLSMARIRTTAEPGLLPSRRLVDLCRLVMSRLGIEVTQREIEALIEQEAVLQGVVAGQDQAVRQRWPSATLAGVRRSDDPAFLLRDPMQVLAASQQPESPFLNVTRFDNGATVAPVLIRCFLSAGKELRSHWTPVQNTAEGSFYSWLNAPSDWHGEEMYSGLPVSNLALYVYRERPDLQRAFPDLSSASRFDFVQWFVRNAASQYGLDRAFIDPVKTALIEWANAPVQPGPARTEECRVTNFILHFYGLRPDLQASFPEVLGRHSASLVEWIAQNLEVLHLDPELLGAARPAVGSRGSPGPQKEEALNRKDRQIESLRAQLNARDRAITSLFARLSNRDQAITSLFTQLSDRDEAIALLQRKLTEAEQASTMVAVGLNNYRNRLSHDLAVYRGQRAWKLMLLARQAYILGNRRGWRGKAEILALFPKLVLGRPVDLWEAELELPDVAAYLPPPCVAPEAIATADEPREAQADVPDEPPAASRRPVKYDVVILAIIDFDFRFQRPQQIAVQFARSGHRVLWVSPTRFLQPDSEKAYELSLLRENLWEVHLRGQLPDVYLGRLEPDHAAGLFESLRTLCQDFAVSESCALLQLPFWRQIGLSLRSEFGSRLVYDCMDEWATFPSMGAFNLSEEESLVRECDLLVVTGHQLLEKFRKAGLKPLLARNAADFEFYERARPTGALDAIAKPIVGFFGGIAAWVDLDLVYEVARLRPAYSFVLIGQVFGHDTSRLEALQNVHLLGSKHYSELPGYLIGFDVCMIPFVLNEVTKAADPVKLYEYFSLGKPVVATDLAELAQCEELLYIAHDAVDFAAKVDVALREDDPQLRKCRIEFAATNTWKARVEDIDREIQQSFPMVSILIVTYNSAQFIDPCLGAILRNTIYPRYEVVVVDNNSTDYTRDLLRRFAEIDERIHLVSLPTNCGFAGGNNAAASQACGDYFVLLNADTMVSPGWLGRLIHHFDRDPAIGLLSPTTNFAGNEVKVNIDYENSEEMETFAMRHARANAGLRTPVSMVPLFCAVVPKTIWETAGGLDEGFEVGMFEDDDFSLRVVRAGYKVMIAEDCFVHHFGRGSFAKLPPERYEQVFQENQRRFEKKWATHWVAHKTRPGVRPPLAERRFSPAEFLQAGARKAGA
jgi:GT2 family glycosyltransferase/SAM-dependent methyltransferase/glycosyltransferase involved in cell wall biosynthesis